uniref:Uncharacterized protein n=1 Tax=Arundo donax TaxID=35708 RepID=A0A0A8YW00_ARUDO
MSLGKNKKVIQKYTVCAILFSEKVHTDSYERNYSL